MFVSGAELIMTVNNALMSGGVFQHARHVGGWENTMEERNKMDRIKSMDIFSGAGFMFDEPVSHELHLYVDRCTVYFYFDKDSNLEGMEVRGE